MSQQNSTYDHSLQRTRHPVRSALDKLESARSVVGSVTTGESLVFYHTLSFIVHVSYPALYIIRFRLSGSLCTRYKIHREHEDNQSVLH
ncbi:hypothetical protein F4825DRAFT_104649 [Nemania diffusa]|nr:hypothetical protein F4825DRAFT_104649 [Nemania diffusa]